jgi:hypothetical protein
MMGESENLQPSRQSAPDAPPFSAAVIITAQRRPDLLRQVLEAVRRLDTEPSEVLVVVSGDHHPDVPMIAAACGARVLLEQIGGLSRARNVGARHSRSEVIAYLDDDALPDPQWLNALVEEFSDPEVGAVAGKVRPPAQPDDEIRTMAIRMGLAYSGGERRLEFDTGCEEWFEMANFGGIGIGPNMAFRRHLFDSWEGFDERIGAGTLIHGGEEGKAFADVLERGHRVVYTPRALVIHPASLTGQEAMTARFLASLAAQTAYLTLLLVEQRRHRKRLLAYLVSAVLRRPRRWRATAGIKAPRAAGPVRTLLAYVSGPFLYLRMRIQFRRSVLRP